MVFYNKANHEVVTMYVPATAKPSQQEIASNNKELPSFPRIESASTLNIPTIRVISNQVTPTIVSSTEIPAISVDVIKTATSASIEAATSVPIGTAATVPFTSIATDIANFNTLKPSTPIQTMTNTLQRTPLTNNVITVILQKILLVTNTATSKVISTLRTHSANPTTTIASVKRPSLAIGNTIRIESML
ncbi:44560_t:CDS:2, partial [Gigaspora margarita]